MSKFQSQWKNIIIHFTVRWNQDLNGFIPEIVFVCWKVNIIIIHSMESCRSWQVSGTLDDKPEIVKSSNSKVKKKEEVAIADPILHKIISKVENKKKIHYLILLLLPFCFCCLHLFFYSLLFHAKFWNLWVIW